MTMTEPIAKADMTKKMSFPRRALRVSPVAFLVLALLAGVAPLKAAGTPHVQMKVLVLTATATDLTLPAIKQALDFLGTPYEVMVTAPAPAAPTDRLAAKLSDAAGTNANYQAVILTTGDLVYSPDGGATFAGGLNANEWASLWAYEAKFGIRQVTWYTYPTQAYGFAGNPGAVDTTVTPLDVPFTAGGQAVFGSYLKTTTPLPIRNAYTYLDKPLDANTTPLLTDAAGNALAAVKTYPDGRQNLALTFSSNQYLLHNMLVSYGLVNWVTRGLFLGERHVYLTPQIDDLLIADATWPVGTPCTTSLEDPSLPEYRITGAELVRASQWQNAKRALPTTANLRYTMAFNGLGSTPDYYTEYKSTNPVGTPPATDTLTPAVDSDTSFSYVNHTFGHTNLDSVSYDEAIQELVDNDAVATGLALPRYKKGNLVTPDISGLANPTFLQGAYDFGIRTLVSDTSRGGSSDNPSPNVGNDNASQPGILQIPRRPVNLYFNVTTPGEWLAEDNCLYPAGNFSYMSTYDKLLEREANVLLTYLVKGDIDPLMFHQSNLRTYDGTKSLLSDLMDRALAKYNTYFTLPVISLDQEVIAQKMTARKQYNTSGVTATLVPGPAGQGPASITLTSPRAATVPVTGLAEPGSEVYGGQNITYVTLAAGQTVTYNLGAPSPPPPPSPTLAIGDATVTEGNSGTTNAVFTVTRTGTATQAITVNYAAANGSASAPGDYTATSGTVTLATSESTKTIAVPVVGDTVFEANETFTVNLSSPVNATIADGQGIGTIVNDDTASPAVSLNPTSLDFGNLRVGRTRSMNVTLTNTGTAPLAITSIGTTVGNFTQTNTCGASVAPAAQCTITVRFAPTSTGAKTGTLTITNNAPNSPQTVPLKGSGTTGFLGLF